MATKIFEIDEITELGEKVFELVIDGDPFGKFVLVDVSEWEVFEAWRSGNDIPVPARTWWPECPYPEEVFPMDMDGFKKLVPGTLSRAAICGMLGRYFWRRASNAIYQAMLLQAKGARRKER